MCNLVDNLNDSIVSADDESRASDVVSSRTDNQETDSEEEIFERGKCYKTLEGHEDDVICVDFNHPKGILVSSSMDGTVRAWDLHRNRCVGDLATHPSLVRCVKVNDAHLLTGSDNGTIKQWDLSMIPPLPSSPSTVSSISSQSDSSSSPTPGESLPSLCNCCVGTLEGHRGEVTALHFENSTAVSLNLCRISWRLNWFDIRHPSRYLVRTIKLWSSGIWRPNNVFLPWMSCGLPTVQLLHPNCIPRSLSVNGRWMDFMIT